MDTFDFLVLRLGHLPVGDHLMPHNSCAPPMLKGFRPTLFGFGFSRRFRFSE